jgi:hypothetical protein
LTKPAKPHRTHPLDRDGDGEPGGSLPGNKTAPMANEALTPEQQSRLELMERETDEANAAVRAGQTPLDAIAEAEPDLVETARQDAEDAEDDATFDAEQIAAGAARDDQPQVAVRIRELSILVEARRLYKSAEGYSATYGAPYIADATVEAWIGAGLAEFIPSAGNQGGVKLTHEARRTLNELKRGDVA